MPGVTCVSLPGFGDLLCPEAPWVWWKNNSFNSRPPDEQLRSRFGGLGGPVEVEGQEVGEAFQFRLGLFEIVTERGRPEPGDLSLGAIRIPIEVRVDNPTFFDGGVGTFDVELLPGALVPVSGALSFTIGDDTWLLRAVGLRDTDGVVEDRVEPPEGSALYEIVGGFRLVRREPVAPIPEPASLALFGLALAGLGLARRRA